MKNKNKVTKFPVARIKRIMQKDEEVGKVAQATPVVISKALELFLQLIVEESHKVTKERGSKRVEAYHLKHAVETVEMLDFLKEIVESVPDPSAGGTIDVEAQAQSPTGEQPPKRKRGTGGGGGRGKARAKAEDGGEDDGPPKRRRAKKDPAQGAKGRGAKGKAVQELEVEEEEREEEEGVDEEPEFDVRGGTMRTETNWEEEDEPLMPR